MTYLHFTTRIHASPAEVFAVATDIPRTPDFIPAITRIEMLTTGPVASGTRFRETRLMFGRPCSEVLQVSDFEPPKAFTISCTSRGCHYRTHFDLRADGHGGTVVDTTFESRAVSPLAALFSPLGFLMKGTMRKMLMQDMACVKDAVESGKHRPKAEQTAA